MTDDKKEPAMSPDDNDQEIENDQTAVAFSKDEIRTYKRLRSAKKPRIGRGWAIFFNFLMICALIAGGVVAAKLYQEQSVELRRAMGAFPRIERQLANLTSENEEAGKTLGARVNTALRDIEQLNTDISDLRALINKRNQQWIRENTDAISKQRKDIGGLLVDVKQFKSRSEVYERGLQTQQNILERTSTAELAFQDLGKSAQNLADDLNRQAQQVEGVKKRLKDEERFTKATAGHRKQINRQYLEINKRLAALRVTVHELEASVTTP